MMGARFVSQLSPVADGTSLGSDQGPSGSVECTMYVSKSACVVHCVSGRQSSERIVSPSSHGAHSTAEQGIVSKFAVKNTAYSPFFGSRAAVGSWPQTGLVTSLGLKWPVAVSETPCLINELDIHTTMPQL